MTLKILKDFVTHSGMPKSEHVWFSDVGVLYGTNLLRTQNNAENQTADCSNVRFH